MTILTADNRCSTQYLHQLPHDVFCLIVEHLTPSEVLTLRICSKALTNKVDQVTSWKERSICILRSFYLSSLFPNFFANQKIATDRSALFEAHLYKKEVKTFLEIKTPTLAEVQLNSLLEKAALAGDLKVVEKSLSLLSKAPRVAIVALSACAQSDFPHVLDWFISTSFFQKENSQVLTEGLVASLRCRSEENFFKIYSILKEEGLIKNRDYFSQLIVNAISFRHFKAFSLLLSLDQGIETQASAFLEVAKCCDPRFSTLFFEVFNPKNIDEYLLQEVAQNSIKHGNILMFRKTAPFLTKALFEDVLKKSYPVAANNGCLEMVKELFSEVASRRDSLSILKLALVNGCNKKREDVVKFFLSQDSAKIFDKTSLNAALMTCVKQNHLALFNDVFSSKEEGFFTSDILSKCLLTAIENESLDMIDSILSKDPNVRLRECPFFNFDRGIYSILIKHQKIDERALSDVAYRIVCEGELDLILQFIESFSSFIDIEFRDRLLNLALQKGNLEIFNALLSTQRVCARFEKQKWLSFFQTAIQCEKEEFVKEFLNHAPKDLEKEDLDKIIGALFNAGSDAITSDLPLYLTFFEIDASQALFFVRKNLNSISDQAFAALLKNQLLLQDKELLSEILELLALEGSVEKIKAIFSTDACLFLKDSSILRAHAHLLTAFRNGKLEAIDAIGAMIGSKARYVLFH